MTSPIKKTTTTRSIATESSRSPTILQSCKLPTKVARGVSGVTAVSVSFARDFVNIREVTVDDIDSFAATRPVMADGGFVPMPENRFKQGIQRVLGETGHFQDWGGEQNDLFTTRTRIDGSRVTTAIAFKGGGTTGTLTLRKMGKNADQIPTVVRIGGPTVRGPVLGSGRSAGVR